MGEIKSLFQKDCEYRYIPGMDTEVQYTNKIRNISMDFMDRVILSGEITKSDYYYMRALAFFRIADEKMIYEFIRFFRSYYGTNECKNLPQLATNLNDIGENEISGVLRRMHRLAYKYVIVAIRVQNTNSDEDYSKTIFCANAVTFSLVRTYFGDTPFFGQGNIRYEHFYSVTPIQKMMETMHACRVGILGFMRHGGNANLVREREITFGSQKEKYTPTMMAEIKRGEHEYRIIIEPIHFSVDERLFTKSEHLKNIEELINTMGRLISHYSYLKLKFSDNPVKKHVRFLIAAENLEGMKKIVQIMNKDCKKYSDKVFFTTDTVLLSTDSLEESVLMAKEVKSPVTGEMHLGLIRAGRDTLISTENEWILTGME